MSLETYATAAKTIDDAFEELRKSYLALLAAACLAEEAGDDKAKKFYDAQANKNRRVLERAGILAHRHVRKSTAKT